MIALSPSGSRFSDQEADVRLLALSVASARCSFCQIDRWSILPLSLVVMAFRSSRTALSRRRTRAVAAGVIVVLPRLPVETFM